MTREDRVNSNLISKKIVTIITYAGGLGPGSN